MMFALCCPCEAGEVMKSDRSRSKALLFDGLRSGSTSGYGEPEGGHLSPRASVLLCAGIGDTTAGRHTLCAVRVLLPGANGKDALAAPSPAAASLVQATSCETLLLRTFKWVLRSPTAFRLEAEKYTWFAPSPDPIARAAAMA